MATTLASKAPSGVLRYAWTPPLMAGDGIASATLTVDSGTVAIDSYDIDDESVYFFVSGGAAGETAIISVEVVTSEGETLPDTLYLPVVSNASQIAHTARQYVTFALRRIIGTGETPNADELSDALERLNALVATWRALGADIGAAFPIEAETVIYCPDWAVGPLRANLLVECLAVYGQEPSAMDVMNARRGLALVKNMSLPQDRAAVYY